MNFNMKVANLLADNIKEFVEYVYKSQNKESFLLNADKLYQIKLLAEEFKFQITAEELHRINQFTWNEKYTHLLVNDFKKGIDVIDEYVVRNYDDLFILGGRLYTLNNLIKLLLKGEI